MNNLVKKKSSSQNIFLNEAINDLRFVIRKPMKRNSLYESVNLSPESPRTKKRMFSIEK